MFNFSTMTQRERLIMAACIAGGALLALIIFFPLEPLKTRILDEVSRQARIEISVEKLGVGTGLGLGFKRGSVFALRGENAVVAFPTGQTLKCHKLIMAPRLWPFLVGQLSFSLYCESQKAGTFLAQMKGRPFWNPKDFAVNLDLENVNLALVEEFTGVGPVEGLLSGTLEMPKLQMPVRGIPTVNWNIQGKDIVSPNVDAAFFVLPSLQMGGLKSQGTFADGRRLKIQEFQFGGPQALIEANFASDMDIQAQGPAIMVTGDFSGKLRLNAELEKSQLKDLNFDRAFGTVKSSGFREFRKKLEGGIQSILLSPPLDNDGT